MKCKTCGFAASDPSMTVCPFCRTQGAVSTPPGGVMPAFAAQSSPVSAAIWPPAPTASPVYTPFEGSVDKGNLTRKVRKSNWCIGLAILCNILAYLLCSTRQAPLVVCGEICQATSVVLFLFGCGFYAEWKGYSALLCLLGFLSIFGLLILLLLPNKNKQRA